MEVPSWYEELEPKYVKFEPGKPVVVTFKIADPKVRPVTWKDGKQDTSLEWPVIVNEGGRLKDKILAVSAKRLKQALKAQDQKASLAGRTLKITAIGEGLQKTWNIEEMQQ